MNEELVQTAKKAYEEKEYRQAADQYQLAAQDYQRAGDLLLAAEMRNNCSVCWLQAGDAQRALEAVVGTEDVFAAANDKRRQAMALGNQAAALDALRQLQEAIEKYEQAAELLKEIGDNDLRTYVLQNLSGLQLRTGNQFQSLATMHTALENKKKLSLKERFLKKLLRLPFKIMR